METEFWLHWKLGGEGDSVDPESTRGYHGYDSESPDMRSFFVANGPAFKKREYLEPFQNVDLFPLMCELLGIPAPLNDGDLTRVIGALESSSSSSSSNSVQVSIPTTTILSKLNRNYYEKSV